MGNHSAKGYKGDYGSEIHQLIWEIRNWVNPF